MRLSGQTHLQGQGKNMKWQEPHNADLSNNQSAKPTTLARP